MIIELYGPPGTGKSTFARSLIAQGAVRRVRHTHALVMGLFSLLYLLRHPVLAWRLFVLVCQYGAGARLFYFKCINVFLQYNAKWAHASLLRGTIVLDQGHHQAVVSLFDESVDEGVLRRLLHAIPKPDMLIVFDLQEPLRQARVEERAYGSVRDVLGEGARTAWEVAMRANHARFVSLVAATPGVRMVRTDEERAQLLDELLKTR